MNPRSLTAPTFVGHSPRRTTSFGEVLAAIYDEASHYSPDPREVTRMAAEVMASMLSRGVLSRSGR